MLEHMCHRFHLCLKLSENGLFLIVGDWEQVDKMANEILKLLALERNSNAFSAAFSDSPSSVNPSGTPLPPSPLVTEAPTKMDIDDQTKQATKGTFQVDTITHDLT
jgi:hypothetical protein